MGEDLGTQSAVDIQQSMRQDRCLAVLRLLGFTGINHASRSCGISKHTMYRMMYRPESVKYHTTTYSVSKWLVSKYKEREMLLTPGERTLVRSWIRWWTRTIMLRVGIGHNPEKPKGFYQRRVMRFNRAHVKALEATLNG